MNPYKTIQNSDGLTRREFLVGTFTAGVFALSGISLWKKYRFQKWKAPTFISKVGKYEVDIASVIRAGFREVGVDLQEIKGTKILLKPNLVEPQAGAGDRMQATLALAPSRQRDVDRARREAAREFSALELRPSRLDGVADLLLGRVDPRAGRLAFLRGQPPEELELRGDAALLAERLDTHGLQGREVAARGDPVQQFASQRFEVGQ